MSDPNLFTLTRAQAKAVDQILNLAHIDAQRYLTSAELIDYLETRVILERSRNDPSIASGRPVMLGLRINERMGGHVHCSLFVGRTEGARGNSGKIVLRNDEYDELVASGAVDVIE